MAMWTLAKKDMRMLVRDARAMVILLAMPIIFILVLGVSLGEGFGQKPDERLRVSLVDLDQGIPLYPERIAQVREGMSWFASAPAPLGSVGGLDLHFIAARNLAAANEPHWFPRASWARVVQRDLAETADIRVEIITDLATAQQLVSSSRRAAVLVFGPNFSKRVTRSSFMAGGWRQALEVTHLWPRGVPPLGPMLKILFDETQTLMPLYLYDGINPYYRDGVQLDKLDVQVLRDPTQATASAIIDQVAQGSLIRVVLPWMIGRAFEKIGDPQFVNLLSRDDVFIRVPGFKLSMKTILSGMKDKEKRELGESLQQALQSLYSKYNLTAKTWAALTKAPQTQRAGAEALAFREEGSGLLKIGSQRYQVLVPSYTVMFAFFLVLTVGWLFVGERRQGTLKRLMAAPLTRAEILLGKLLPCLFVSLFQGIFLLVAGRYLFGMSWGPEPLWLFPVVAATSLAAMGLALLVAALARTETQVAIYGTLLVLVLAGLSGSLMGDRALMPDVMQEISRITPHAWALDAYRQLLTTGAAGPNLIVVQQACLVLTAFGIGFIALAWVVLRLD
jgi:ABC-type multidrug transport system permease subunit